MEKGVYDRLVTAALLRELAELPPHLRYALADLSTADSVEYFARHVAQRVRARLLSESEEVEDKICSDFVNQLLGHIEELDPTEQRRLIAVYDAVSTSIASPLIPLSQSALITNDQGLNHHAVLRSELATADRVDLICPFIGNQGLNLIMDLLAPLGSNLRVITTTYLGATNQRALDRIVATGAQVKIVYERSEQKTGLHAKAWIFHRNSGFTTASVGSSNLSPRALVDGLEWNIRLSIAEAPQLLQKLEVTFLRLWDDQRFESFQPERDSDRLRRALSAQRSARTGIAFFADLVPLPHQEEALSELDYARLEGKNENLIVAATGTGKTLLAAFDYRRLCAQFGGRPSLLFVAHREDILQQSIGAFRAVMKDSDFGELNVGIDRADAWRHVFASIQSLGQRNLTQLAQDHFDVIIIDEFHHADPENRTYQRLLDHFVPKQLLGLTATPERTSGYSVVERFGVPTFELRLWHALDRGLLCPFHYYGINDNTDLSDIDFARGRYPDSLLDRSFVENGRDRAGIIIRELLERVDDPDRMRAVAFCATIRHAKFMEEQFSLAGLNARALHSDLSREERRELVHRFRSGDLPLLCTVDLFNEGVDIPEIDTVLFLRPTESATVFIQQLGRGLRNSVDKGALTVLDFVGQQNRKFRMDLRYRAMTGLSRSELEHAIRNGFPRLPPGCHIKLDRTTEERVLKNVRDAIPSNTRALVEELRRMAAARVTLSLVNLLHEAGVELSDIYKGRSFNALLYAAGLASVECLETRRAGSFIHVDDRLRLEAYRQCLMSPPGEGCWERMLAFTLGRGTSLASLDTAIRDEMFEVLDARDSVARSKQPLSPDLPYCLHSSYTRDEIVAPFRDNPASMRQGTFYVQDLGLDVPIVTLRKSEQDYSPTTRYRDFFTEPDRLHWESQSTTTVDSPTGRRLIQGIGRHLFFVRENKVEEGRTSPFLCAGFASPVASEGEKPIRLVWKLEHAIPDHIYVRFEAAAG